MTITLVRSTRRSLSPLLLALSTACRLSDAGGQDDATSSEGSGSSSEGTEASDDADATASTSVPPTTTEASTDDSGISDASDGDDTTTIGDASNESSSTGDVPAPFTVSNEDDFGPLAPTGLELGPPNGTFDTDFDCTEDSVLGICESITTASAYACVCRADRLLIGDLRVVGSRALVILAWSSVEVIGTLDIGGEGGAPGAGVSFEYDEEAEGAIGGAGGSFGTSGGRDADDPYGNDTLVPLAGGMSGQDGCGQAAGGGGGGALQISAGEELHVDGEVIAGGGGGEGGSASDSCNGGAGGGSGGAVLLESLLVSVAGTVAANGGGGGGGGTSSYLGNDGEDAVSADPALGGEAQIEEPCPLGDTVYSGVGGVGASTDEPATDGGPSDDETVCFPDSDVWAGEGGGGGGAGRLRINTSMGAQGCVCAGDISPSPSFGSVDA